jgi:hypothetical protein
MDIKAELDEALSWGVMAGRQLPPGGVPVTRELLQRALAEIERLERYAQHTPACPVVNARLRGNYNNIPESQLCNCGLLSQGANRV